MNLPDDPELRRVEAMLRAIDPGRGAAQALSERGRRRVLWSWRHPLLAWCMRHHVAIAVSVAAVVVVVLFLWMVREQRAIRQRQEVPKPVSAPVRVLGCYDDDRQAGRSAIGPNQETATQKMKLL